MFKLYAIGSGPFGRAWQGHFRVHGSFPLAVTAAARRFRFIATSIFLHCCRQTGPPGALIGWPLSSIVHRMSESMTQLRLAPEIRPDSRGVALDFKRSTFSVDVVPGFLMRISDSHPVYLMPGEDNRWIEAAPEWHNTLFSRSNAKCGAKLQAISRLVKAWRFAGCPPFEISSLYVDMMLATSDIASGVKSYGQSLSDFFTALVERELRGLSDPAGVSGVIVASSSNAALERLYEAAKAAAAHAQAAFDAQLRGDNAEANHQWETIFRRRITRRHQHAIGS